MFKLFTRKIEGNKVIREFENKWSFLADDRKIAILIEFLYENQKKLKDLSYLILIKGVMLGHEDEAKLAWEKFRELLDELADRLDEETQVQEDRPVMCKPIAQGKIQCKIDINLDKQVSARKIKGEIPRFLKLLYDNHLL